MNGEAEWVAEGPIFHKALSAEVMEAEASLLQDQMPAHTMTGISELRREASVSPMTSSVGLHRLLLQQWVPTKPTHPTKVNCAGGKGRSNHLSKGLV